MYGLLRGGDSLTAFVLDALTRSGPVPDAVVEGGLAFLTGRRHASGALGLSGPAPDYPTYTTALYLSVLARVQPEGWQSTAAPSLAWLAGQQLPADAAGAGGFPMGQASPPAPGARPHVDLSMTRRALEALSAHGAGDLAAGAQFARSCITANDGFLYSPIEAGVNKGDAEGGTQLGYGSATTDGLLALLACGVAPSDDAITRGLAFLHRVHTWDENPGIGDGPLASYATAMRGYWRGGAARVYAALEGPAGWRTSLADTYAAEQNEDGSWVSPFPLQKEDEPLISTGFAVLALGA